ncbi:MAG TPA: hypothetical protein VLA21_01270 [Candidatus Limnocylindria bacterium]|nr:hypothetical protein [Candidatus Limnocylindria bacterium]
MSKRILSALLCAVLMLGALPFAAPGARMAATAVHVTVNRTTATLGEVLVWTMNVVPEGSNYQTRIRVYANGGVVYEGPFTTGRTHTYTPQVAGNHYAEAIAYDNSDSVEISTNSAVTKVNKRPAPTLTAAVPFSATAARLTWTAVEGADGYKVFMATAEGGPYSPAGFSTGLTYTKTYLTPGTKYWFKVSAYNLVGGVKTDSSNLSAAKLVVPVGPGVIKTIASPSAGRVTLTWNAVPGATGYEVSRSAVPGGPFVVVKATTALSFTDTGLASGKYFYYRLQPYRRIYVTNYYGAVSPVKAVRTK